LDEGAWCDKICAMRTSPPDPARIRAMQRAMTIARGRCLHNLSDENREPELKILYEAAAEFTRDWTDLGGRERIRRFLTAAAEKIVKDRNASAEVHKDRVLRSFGLLKGLERITDPDMLLRRAVKDRGDSPVPNTVRDNHGDARHALAVAALTMIDEIRLVRKLRGQAPYEERLELESRFAFLVEEVKPNVVCFVGPRGTGKSTLARKLLQRLAAERTCGVIILSAASENDLYRDIAHELSAHGVSTSALSQEEISREFAKFVAAKTQARPVVLLDDVASWETVGKIVPTCPSTLFLATSNIGELPPSINGATIEVGPMSLAEAEGLARKLICPEHATDEECRSLASSLGCLALAISHAAALVDSGHLSVEKFITALHEQPQSVFNVSRGSGRRSLTLIYEELFEVLYRDCDEAFVMLCLAGHLDGRRINKTFLAKAFEQLWSRYNQPHMRRSAEFAYARSLQELQRLRVLEITDEHVEMHSVTRMLVASLARPCAEDVFVAIRDAFVGFYGESPFTRDWLHADRDVEHLLVSIKELVPLTKPRDRARLKLGHMAAMALRIIASNSTASYRTQRCAELLHAFNGVGTEDLDALDLASEILRAGYETQDPAAKIRSVELPKEHGDSLFTVACLLRIKSHIAQDPTMSDLSHILSLKAFLILGDHDLVVEEFPDPARLPEDLVERGQPLASEVLLLVADAYAALGEWRKAWAAYYSCYERCFRDRLVVDDILRGISANLGLIRCSIAMGDLVRGEEWLARAISVAERHETAMGRTMLANISHEMGRYGIAWEIEALVQQIDNRRLGEGSVDGYLTHSLGIYKDLGRWRDVLAVEYDMLRYHVAVTGCPVDFDRSISELANKASLVGEEGLRLRCKLLGQKVGIVRNIGASTAISRIADRCAEIAYDFGLLGLGHWYHQGLAVAHLASILTRRVDRISSFGTALGEPSGPESKFIVRWYRRIGAPEHLPRLFLE
jgi:energy-coupling factor transporter ATP-binding protein EcfA2